MKSLMRIAALATALGATAGLAQAATAPFTATSSSFKDGAVLPLKYAGALKANPNCLGQNVSPALSWSNAPAGTKSFVVMMVDSEGRNGLGVNHWVAYGIAPTVHGFAEGEVSAVSPKYIGGKSTQGFPNYIGPCPGPGTAHHYDFVVVATDLDPGALAPGLTREQLIAQLDGHALADSGVVAVFQHP